MSKVVAPDRRDVQETEGTLNFAGDPQHVKHTDPTFHHTRRTSLKHLPFFKGSFDSSKGSDESQASLCKTSEVQNNYQRMQRSMSVDMTSHNAVSSHRPRSQRIAAFASARQRTRKPVQVNPMEAVATSPSDKKDVKTSTDQLSNNNITKTKSDVHLRSLPGRTPPMNKTVNLSLARDHIHSLDATDGQKRVDSRFSEKLRLDLGESADDSFCWCPSEACRDSWRGGLHQCMSPWLTSWPQCRTKWFLTARTVIFIFYHNIYI